MDIVKFCTCTGYELANKIYKLKEEGMLHLMLPEVYDMIGMKQSPLYHPEGDVFEHTMCALKCNKEGIYPEHNLSVLFHDVGKTITYTFKDGKHHYRGHDFFGSDMIPRITKRYSIPNDIAKAMYFSTRYHMWLHKAHELKSHKLKFLGSLEDCDTLMLVGVSDNESRCIEGYKGTYTYDFLKLVIKNNEMIPFSEFEKDERVSGYNFWQKVFIHEAIGILYFKQKKTLDRVVQDVIDGIKTGKNVSRSLMDRVSLEGFFSC